MRSLTRSSNSTVSTAIINNQSQQRILQLELHTTNKIPSNNPDLNHLVNTMPQQNHTLQTRLNRVEAQWTIMLDDIPVPEEEKAHRAKDKKEFLEKVERILPSAVRVLEKLQPPK